MDTAEPHTIVAPLDNEIIVIDTDKLDSSESNIVVIAQSDEPRRPDPGVILSATARQVPLQLKLAAAAAILGAGYVMVAENDGKKYPYSSIPRRYRYQCQTCGDQIPPGREGRDCKLCRAKTK